MNNKLNKNFGAAFNPKPECGKLNNWIKPSETHFL